MKHLFWLVLLLLCPLTIQAQTFSPDGTHLLTSARNANGQVALAIITLDGKNVEILPDSVEATIGVWSPNGKQILFLDKARRAMLYTLEKKTAQMLAEGIEAPLTWREDGKAFAGIKVTLEKDGTPTRELCRFDIEGYPMGRTSVSDLSIEPRYPLHWIAGTDEVALFARHREEANAYLTDANSLRRISTSHDLHGLGAIAGGKQLLWARRGMNLRYILMTLYRFNTTISTVERLTFPERLTPLNPNPRTAPESLGQVAFNGDGSFLLLTVTIKVNGKEVLRLYSTKGDGTGTRLLHEFTTPPKKVPSFPARFSPDGRRVVWEEGESLFQCDVEGTNKTKIPLPLAP